MFMKIYISVEIHNVTRTVLRVSSGNVLAPKSVPSLTKTIYIHYVARNVACGYSRKRRNKTINVDQQRK